MAKGKHALTIRDGPSLDGFHQVTAKSQIAPGRPAGMIHHKIGDFKMAAKTTEQKIAELTKQLKVLKAEQSATPRKRLLKACGGSQKGYGHVIDILASALEELNLLDQVINHLAPPATEEAGDDTEAGAK